MKLQSFLIATTIILIGLALPGICPPPDFEYTRDYLVKPIPTYESDFEGFHKDQDTTFLRRDVESANMTIFLLRLAKAESIGQYEIPDLALHSIDIAERHKAESIG